MEALQEEVGTWPAAYWYLEQDSGVPDHIIHPNGPTLILFSSMERAARFHEKFPSARLNCSPEAVGVGRVQGLVLRHFLPNAVRFYVLDPAPEDFDERGRYKNVHYHWLLNLVGLCGYLPV